jgi:hypothetical protein
MTRLTINIISAAAVALLLWACSRNAIVVGERQERKFQKWKQQQEHDPTASPPDGE